MGDELYKKFNKRITADQVERKERDSLEDPPAADFVYMSDKQKHRCVLSSEHRPDMSEKSEESPDLRSEKWKKDRKPGNGRVTVLKESTSGSQLDIIVESLSATARSISELREIVEPSGDGDSGSIQGCAETSMSEVQKKKEGDVEPKKKTAVRGGRKKERKVVADIHTLTYKSYTPGRGENAGDDFEKDESGSSASECDDSESDEETIVRKADQVVKREMMMMMEAESADDNSDLDASSCSEDEEVQRGNRHLADLKKDKAQITREIAKRIGKTDHIPTKQKKLEKHHASEDNKKKRKKKKKEEKDDAVDMDLEEPCVDVPMNDDDHDRVWIEMCDHVFYVGRENDYFEYLSRVKADRTPKMVERFESRMKNYHSLVAKLYGFLRESFGSLGNEFSANFCGILHLLTGLGYLTITDTPPEGFESVPGDRDSQCSVSRQTLRPNMRKYLNIEVFVAQKQEWVRQTRPVHKDRTEVFRLFYAVCHYPQRVLRALKQDNTIDGAEDSKAFVEMYKSAHAEQVARLREDFECAYLRTISCTEKFIEAYMVAAATTSEQPAQ